MNYATDGVWHKHLLAVIAERMKPHCFLELGLGGDPAVGYVAQHADVSYGVDRYHDAALAKTYRNTMLIRATTDEFFEGIGKIIEPPDLVLIDADHDKDQVLKDLRGVAAICAPNCLVAIHDTFPEGDHHTRPELCSNSYQVPAELDCEHVTLPFPPGVTLCRLRPQSLV